MQVEIGFSTPLKVAPLNARTDIVVVDRSTAFVELLARRLEELGHSTIGHSNPVTAIDLASGLSAKQPQIVLAGLTFPSFERNGLDIALAFTKWCPETAIIIYVDESTEEMRLLRVVWDAIHPASALSRRSSVSDLVQAIHAVAEDGRTEPDQRLRHLTPTRRSPWRTGSAYQRLVPHAGHAKLWKVLLDHEGPPPYKTIAAEAHLSVNTIRSYRDDLLPELSLHGLDKPRMREIHRFAHLVRPLLEPVVHARLAAKKNT